MRHLRDGWMPPDQRRRYWFGVDLGQSRNFTAMAVLERRWKMATPEEFLVSAGRAYHGEWLFDVVKLERIELGTPYTDIADWIREEVGKVDERLPREVVLDGTGVGSAVKDQLRMRRMRVDLTNVVVTGGEQAGSRTDARATYVSRTELLTRLAVAVENAEFVIDPKCRERKRLEEELIGLRRKGKPAGGGQDDLAFALALAVWKGLRV